MKRNLFYLTAVTAIIAVTFAACTPDISTLPMGVSLDLSSLTLAPGESLKLTAEVMPDEATNKTLTWESDDANVATVTDGVVTAIAEGKARITVTTKSGQKMAACLLTVAYPVDYVTLDNSVAVLTVGKSQRLTATVMPNDAPDISVKWESNNPGVAEVVDGVITAKSIGTAIVTVTTVVGGREAKCTVRVIPDKHILMTGSWFSASVYLVLAGSGTVNINWGDNSTVETLTLTELPTGYNHNYAKNPPYTITIEGGDVTNLACSGNQLTNLELSNMTGLITLNCLGNDLKSLDVSGCTALEDLRCNSNQLKSLDVSNLVALTYLDCRNNQLTSMDLSNNTKLTNFICNNNWFYSLNVSNTRIKSLNVSDISLSYLVVNNNEELTELKCSNNRLSNLDVSYNIALTTLDCSGNQLTNLSVNNNLMLQNLDCQLNKLSAEALNDLFETLNETAMVGGKTIKIPGNPGTFTCDKSIATDKGWEVIIGNYMTMTFQSNLQTLLAFSINGKGMVMIDWGDGSPVEQYTLNNWVYYPHYYSSTQPYTITIMGENIWGLSNYSCPLTSLDVSNNAKLTELYCSNNNRLTSLDVSKNILLNILHCNNNGLTSLDVSNNSNLTEFYCTNNQLTRLDVSNLIVLVRLDCSSNQFSAEALNDLFKTLHNNLKGKNKDVYIRNNPGANTCDRSIATNKGWWVSF